MKKFFILLFILVPFSLALYAQRVEKVEVYSDKMKRTVKNIVILPEQYDQEAGVRYPVVYLLHGHGGNETTWSGHTKKTLPQDAGKWGVIFVCPDGKNSWYWDSPLDPASQFETYVSKELVGYIDSHYNTVTSSKGRAITGFSMGGHGALWLAINHPDVFGACGSMSGGVDIRPFPKNWNMPDALGPYKENKEVWNSHTVMTQLANIEPGKLSIIVDCGTEDFFYEVNENLHKQMLYYNIPHDYISRPGGHTHPYWNEALDYHLLFFSNFFKK